MPLWINQIHNSDLFLRNIVISWHSLYRYVWSEHILPLSIKFSNIWGLFWLLLFAKVHIYHRLITLSPWPFHVLFFVCACVCVRALYQATLIKAECHILLAFNVNWQWSVENGFNPGQNSIRWHCITGGLLPQHNLCKIKQGCGCEMNTYSHFAVFIQHTEWKS